MTPAVVDEWVRQVLWEDRAVTESRLRILIQPRPRWLPEWVWRRLLARVLVLEERR